MNRDNTVSFQNHALQLQRVGWKATLAGCQVTVHQHLDGTLSLTHGPHRLGCFNAQGEALAQAIAPARRAVEKTRGGKVKNTTFPPRLEIPQTRGIPTFPQPRRRLVNLLNRTYHVLLKPDILTCYGHAKVPRRGCSNMNDFLRRFVPGILYFGVSRFSVNLCFPTNINPVPGFLLELQPGRTRKASF